MHSEYICVYIHISPNKRQKKECAKNTCEWVKCSDKAKYSMKFNPFLDIQ